MTNQKYFAYSPVIIDSGAQIGIGTQIRHFCHQMGTCKVGENCKIGQNVYIDDNAVIGNR